MIVPSRMVMTRSARPQCPPRCVTTMMVTLLAIERLQGLHDVIGRAGIEIAGGLVGKEQTGLLINARDAACCWPPGWPGVLRPRSPRPNARALLTRSAAAARPVGGRRTAAAHVLIALVREG
jgi:hypothetical protein